MKKYFLLIFSFCFLEINAQSTDGHDYVNLGLPSGTLWATSNVGANSPEAYGNYFAWGETTHQQGDTYLWSSYKWCQGAKTTIIKYCTSSDYGNVDGKTELDSDDDAATVNWSSNWCMPTREQFDELFNSDYTTSKWSTQKGVYGALITSKMPGYTDKSVFLPAAGYYEDGSFKGAGQGGYGYYWSKSLSANASYKAYSLGFQPRSFDTDDGLRYCGFTVRAVRAHCTTGISTPTSFNAGPVYKKYLSNGQIVIDKDGKKYNIYGIELIF